MVNCRDLLKSAHVPTGPDYVRCLFEKISQELGVNILFRKYKTFSINNILYFLQNTWILLCRAQKATASQDNCRVHGDATLGFKGWSLHWWVKLFGTTGTRYTNGNLSRYINIRTFKPVEYVSCSTLRALSTRYQTLYG